MKRFLPLILLLLTGFSYSQKYVLIDKKMSLPVTYSDNVTIQDNYKGYFAIEKEKINDVISQVDKISALLSNPKQKKESFSYKIGSTSFTGLLVSLAEEERLDVVMITDCGQVKTILHLCDAKISNVNNAYYITTLVKYIKSSVK